MSLNMLLEGIAEEFSGKEFTTKDLMDFITGNPQTCIGFNDKSKHDKVVCVELVAKLDNKNNDDTDLLEPFKRNISYKTIISIRYNLKQRIFYRIKQCIIEKINKNVISSFKTEQGNTQIKERITINFIKSCLEIMNYSYVEAGSQQSKDFRNIQKIGLNIEVKKTDSLTVYFNDTRPSFDIFYVIIFTGKQFKTKPNLPPKIIFINGYDLIKDDLYYLEEYKKDIEYLKNKWGRKKIGLMANKLKNFSVYPRPTYKININHLINSNYSCNI